MLFRESSGRALVILLAAALPALLGCGDTRAAPPSADDRPAPRTAAASVLGTLHATLNGEPRMWYVVSGQAQDGPYASGVWIEIQDGGYMLAIGGLDTEDPPMDTFTRSGQLSMGAYEGSALTLNVQVAAGDAERTYTLPDDESAANVMYMPVVDMENMTNMLTMTGGTVEVDNAELSGGEFRARGTFSGTLEPMAGGAAVRLTDGRFDVRGLPSADAIQPTGTDS